MGKTKTAILTEEVADTKTSEEKYREKKLKKAQKDTSAPQESDSQQGGSTDVSKKPVQKKHGKKYEEMKAKVSAGKSYSLTDALKLVKEVSYSKFDGSVEAHIVVKKAGFTASIDLPHSAGKAKKVEVASDETIEKLEKGKIDFDVLLATAEMMPKLVPFAKVLGPRGMMPNPKNGTLIKEADLPAQAGKFSGNTLRLKTEKTAPLIHTVIGKVSQDEKELKANLEKLIDGVSKQLVKIYIKPTMGPSIKVNL